MKINWGNVAYVVVVILILLWLLRVTKNFNLPGENVMSVVLVLLLLAYRAHNMRAHFARNILLALLIFYLPTMSRYAEPGTYDPRAYLSLLVKTAVSFAIVVSISMLIGRFWR
jgi:hypothetical protein